MIGWVIARGSTPHPPASAGPPPHRGRGIGAQAQAVVTPSPPRWGGGPAQRVGGGGPTLDVANITPTTPVSTHEQLNQARRPLRSAAETTLSHRPR